MELRIIPTYEEALEIRKEYEQKYGTVKSEYSIDGKLVTQEEYCRHTNKTPEMLAREFITFNSKEEYEKWQVTRQILKDATEKQCKGT